MNRIYKVVWSKVKNCYVVVSEIAKNIISGSVNSAKVGMVPVVKGIALGTLMAFVITGNAYAENYAEGIVARTGDIIKEGNLTFNISNTPFRYVAIHAHDDGEVEAITLNAMVNGGSFAAGVEANDGGKVSFGNTTLIISDNGKKGSEAYGINVARKGTANVTGNINANVISNAWVTGLEAYNGSAIEVGSFDAKVDNVELSVLANGTDNDVNDGDGIRAHGIYVVGKMPNQEDIVAYEEISDEEEVSYGRSIVNVHTNNLTITSNAANGKAYGIISEDSGVVNANGNVSVTASGNKAYGIEALTGSKVELGEEDKNVSITASCKGDNVKEVIAIAVYVEGEDSKVDIVADNLIVRGEKEREKENQRRRSLVAKNNAVINITANIAEFLGRFIASGGSEINIDASTSFNGNTPFDVSDDSQINLIYGDMSGTMNILNGNVNLTGAMFTPTIAYNDNAILENYITGAGKLILDDAGVLKTVVEDVFSNVNTKNDNIDENTFGKNSKIIYKGGYISLEEDYSYDYLKSALRAIENYKYDGSNASSTKLIMTGNMVSTSITAEQASALENKAELNSVTVKSDKNLLVGADVSQKIDVEGIGVENSVNNGFSANQLELGNGSTGAIITGGQEIVLGGSQNDTSENAHEVVTVGGRAEEVTIVVGTESKVGNAGETKGALKIGNSVAQKTDEFKLTGKAVVNNGSELHTKGETTITEGIELKGGKVNVEEGHHLNADIKANGENNVIRGKVTSEKLEAEDKNTRIHLGDKEHAGKMYAKESNLNGGILFLDPEIANNISEASVFTLETARKLDGGYVAGQNSVISLGVSDRDAAEKVFAKTDLSFGNEGDVDAVVYIAGTTNIDSGSITANGSLTSEDNYVATVGKVTFENNTLLMVEANNVEETAAITGVKSVTIADGAKLYINDAVKNKTYKILSGSGINAEWSKENIFSNNQLVTFETILDGEGTSFSVTTGLQKVSEVYGNDVVIADVVDRAMFSETFATDFFKAAVDENNNTTKEAQIDAMNSVGSINELAGVSHATGAISNIFAGGLVNHLSIGSAINSQKGGYGVGMLEDSSSKNVWAQYVHAKEDIDGLKGAGEYNAQYNGIVVGADLYKEGKVTVGAALTYVDGNVNGSTLASRTENDAKYYGASIYGRVENEDTAIIADASYLHGEHDITQRNSGVTITGKPESDAFSVGVRLEKEANVGIGKLVPYAGLRYMRLGIGNYTNSIGLNYDTEDASLFLVPVGVKYSSEIHNENGWTVRPIAEVGYVWAFGDTDANQTVSLAGASNSFSYDVMDSGSYVGRLMIEAEKANNIYSLGYEYQKGDSVKSDRWMFNVNWRF